MCRALHSNKAPFTNTQHKWNLCSDCQIPMRIPVGGSERKDLICVLINDKSEEETFYLGCQAAKASSLNTLVVTFITNLHKTKNLFIFFAGIIVIFVKVHYVLSLAKHLRIKLVWLLTCLKASICFIRWGALCNNWWRLNIKFSKPIWSF